MTGRLVRIGGKVDQLFNYKNCSVDDINVVNLRARKFGTTTVGKLRYAFDLFEQELRFFRKGFHAVRDRRTHFFDIHDAIADKKFGKHYDGIMSSNVVEHSYNVIWFLLNMHFLVKDTGYHYHAIPCYRFTFDKFRTPTTIQHFIDDFKNSTSKDNLDEHAQEHYDSALKDAQDKSVKKPAFPHIHCHVFDEHNTRELFELMFEEVTVDIIQTSEFNDVIVLCRNTLNKRFKQDFSDIIKNYGIA